jgi:ribose transport system ATP-binding protein
MKLLSQVERPSEGEIELSGEPVEFHGPRYAQTLGVAMVYQGFAMASLLSISQEPVHETRAGTLQVREPEGRARGVVASPMITAVLTKVDVYSGLHLS